MTQTIQTCRGTIRYALLSLSVLALGAGLVACDGDGGQPVKTEGSSIMISSVVSVRVTHEGGGFTAPPPAGSMCLVGARKFDLVLATRALTWTLCVGDGVMPYRETPGGRTLTATEFTDLKTLLRKLTVVKPDFGCLADAPMLTVTVRTATAEQQYVDDKFQCHVPDKPYLRRSAIDDVLKKLETFTK